MSQNIVYVGIDVDGASYHGCALNQRTGEVLDFHCRPTLKDLAASTLLTCSQLKLAKYNCSVIVLLRFGKLCSIA